MKTKILTLVFVCIFLVVCASLKAPQSEVRAMKLPEAISFDEIWKASLEAIDDLGLVVFDKNKEEGFIYAKKREGHTIETPEMDIFIKREDGRVKVSCFPHVGYSSMNLPNSLREDRKWADVFFSALREKLSERR